MLAAALVGCAEEAGYAVPDPLVIRVRGERYEWHVQYPGRDGQLDTADDRLAKRDLHLPHRANVRIELESRDYIYGFRIPAFEVNEMAIPELDLAAPFEAGRTGTFDLQGDQMCGFQHSSLIGRVVVHDRSSYGEWLREVEAE